MTITRFPLARGIRFLSTPRVAVIGSGPSAFYTSLDILKYDIPVEIDMFEKRPCPFGLVRFGVAPDHPEVKSCQERFQDASKDKRFQFFGNVEIGKDIKLRELYENYDSIVFAYGSNKENRLNIAGEDHPAVINSKDFVGWYNGDPQDQDLNPPLDKVEEVTIIGNGNVAMDIVRVLLAPPEHWKDTDIVPGALETLQRSTVKKVTVSARRGFLDSKFANKEFRECLEMDKYGVRFTGWGADLFGDSLKTTKLGRIEKRRLQLAEKYCVAETEGKSWKLDYLKTPIGIKVDSKDPLLLKETIFKKNQITPAGKIEPTNKLASVSNQLLILCIGYKGEALAEFEELGIPFDVQRGAIPNKEGRVVGVEQTYCVGWIANGSRGSINSTVADSSVVAHSIVQDLDKLPQSKGHGREKVSKLLAERGVNVVDWSNWVKIDKAERQQGRKFTDFDSMLSVSNGPES
ncbi:hypothetical protein OGAPHI_006858 [Ogataea philodendri]|uniref:NADPH:adrenodoxin oxidoreductase, mitochondrial n=1 Tax=Ogataea philodendri TaxID=1378263 RepID=A0A9P8NV78_9ASCO|nr:uncharacterized protein OGAPHI_006858 [Ogataea philodendri]KAH3660272.1 hypothetical protein OGAPHI_006858 [Ogataea philodendri]